MDGPYRTHFYKKEIRRNFPEHPEGLSPKQL